MNTISESMKMSTDGDHMKSKCGLLLPDYVRLKVLYEGGFYMDIEDYRPVRISMEDYRGNNK